MALYGDCKASSGRLSREAFYQMPAWDRRLYIKLSEESARAIGDASLFYALTADIRLQDIYAARDSATLAPPVGLREGDLHA